MYFVGGKSHSEDEKELNVNKQQVYLHFRNLSVWMKEDFFSRMFSKMFTKTTNNLGMKFVEQIQMKDEKKGIQILSDVTGFIAPGQLVAILGTSGSGKTTLLNTLSYRLLSSQSGVFITQDNGEAEENNLNKSKKELSQTLFYYEEKEKRWISNIEEIRNLIGYVMQHDCLLPNLTCYETLYYAGLLRLPVNLTKSEKLQIIERTMIELGLRDCANVRVGGDSVSGKSLCLSGGERRRLSIAIQLLTYPSVLFLDEPTSGLDSFTANKLMNTLVNLAHSQKRTIVCTVHQPRTEILKLFDKCLLLSKGFVVYFGDSFGLVNYFANISFQCPSHVNPADYLLDLISIDPRSEEAHSESTKRLKFLVSKYKTSLEHQSQFQSIDQLIHQSNNDQNNLNLNNNNNENNLINNNNNNNENNNENKKKKKGKKIINNTPFYLTLPILMSRAYTNLSRNPLMMITRIAQVMALGVILSLCYLRVGDDQYGIQNMQGFLYECLALVFVGLLNAVAIFTEERNIFYRERQDGMYGTLPFFLSYMSTELPFEILSVVLYSILTYVVLGLRPIWYCYLIFLFTVFCVTFTGESFGIFLCSIFYGVGIANTIASVALSLALIMSGFFRPVDELPAVLKYIDYTLMTSYATSVLATNQFEDQEYVCVGSQYLSNGVCPFTTGEQVLESMGINTDRFWLYFSLMIILTISYRVLAFLVLKYKKVNV